MSLFFQGILAGIFIGVFVGIFVVALMQAARTNGVGERMVRD